MAYSSLTAILTIVPNLPQTTTATGYTETSLVVADHIVRADSMINALIGRRYAVPLSPTPPYLSTISEDITSYYTFRSFYTQDNTNRIDYFEELRDTALESLKMLREGDIDLVDTSGSLIPERENETGETIIDSTTIDFATFFDVDDSLSWRFDASLEDEVANGRN